MAEYYLREDFAGDLTQKELLSWADAVASNAAPEQVFRNKEGRKTLRFERAGRSYFLKLHSGIGWGEIIKNLVQLRLPVLGARNEFRAVEALQTLGVDTLSVGAYASEGWNPAAIHSLIVTDDLDHTLSLEDYCADWLSAPPSAAIRRRLLIKVADSARRMHGAGINHRDFYLCHFHLDERSLTDGPLRCHLIDLHRAQLRRHTPRRWRVKDLAGLYFSAMDCGLSRRDLLRFIRHYDPQGLRGALSTRAALWRDVEVRAQRLYLKEHGRQAPTIGVTGP